MSRAGLAYDDLLRLCLGSLLANRLRSGLSMLGITIGIAAVVLLTTIGEGTREFVLGQFTQFGTNIVVINPGKTETFGIPGVLGGSTQKLTLDDAQAVARIPGVLQTVPVVLGQAAVEARGRSRSVFVYGVGPAMPEVWRFDVRQGQFLPEGDPRRGVQVAVLGSKLKQELFGAQNALGRFVRVAGTRLRVIGVMAPKGKILGQDVDDSAFVPTATAMTMFNTDELMEIEVTFAPGRDEEVVSAIRRLLIERHRGREDFTLTTQAAMLDVFSSITRMITIGLGAIGGISLLVGAVGILTMMWIAVGERTDEIGLLRAIGATSRQVLALFLTEAAVLSLAGGVSGVGAGLGIAYLLKVFVPGLPLDTPPEFVVAAVVVSFSVGLLSGVLPARRAAALDPIEALRAE